MTAAAPRFSVVLTVPADTTELDLISLTVTSACAQFPDWELIVVAGGGRSMPVLDRADLRVRLLAAETGADDTAMYNRALAAALGEFVVVAAIGDMICPTTPCNGWRR